MKNYHRIRGLRICGILSVLVLVLFNPGYSQSAVDAGLVFDLTGASSESIDALCAELTSSPQSSAAFFIPWDSLEVMRRQGPSENLRRLFSSGAVELLSGVYYDIDPRHASEDILHSQTRRFKMLAESVSGGAVAGFYPAGGQLSSGSLGILRKLGFKYALSDESAIGEAVEAQRLQAFLMPDSLLLYSISSRISKAASLPPAAGWLEEFIRTAGVVCGDIAGSIPGGTVVFSVALEAYSPADVTALFAAMRNMNIKVSSIRKLSLRQPAYFKELSSVRESEAPVLGRFQEFFLAEWHKFQSMASDFPASLAENIYRMGQTKFFASSDISRVTPEMLSLTEAFYDVLGSVEFSSGDKNILAVSSSYFRIYFSADNLNPVLIALPGEGLIIAGDPSGKTDDHAMKSYFNFRSYEKGWDIKVESKSDYWRLSALLTDSPLEMKKTFVLTKGRDSFKYYSSLQNAGASVVSCDVALSVVPAAKSGIHMRTSLGDFAGSFRSSAKEFGEIKELAFPAEGKAPILKFVANFPHFLTLRDSSAELSYRRRELGPSARILTESHFSYGDFESSDDAKELFSYTDIFLDGVPNESFWASAQRFIDPRRDGPEGADFTDIYYARGPDCSYMFAEGEFENSSNLYIARKGQGSNILSSKLKVPDEITYYVKLPLSQGSPSAYKWEGVWLNTFEKGFAMHAGKSIEIRLPMILQPGEWAVYLESDGKIGDSVDLELK